MPAAASAFHSLDWIILDLHLGGTMAMGFYFFRRTRSIKGYTAGNRTTLKKSK